MLLLPDVIQNLFNGLLMKLSDIRFFDRLLHRRQNRGVNGRDEYGRTMPELTQSLLEICKDKYQFGTVARGQRILHIIASSSSITETLTTDYFDNLAELLRMKQRRAIPGKVALGLGSGRCGSTSLAALLATVDDSCCTHENPPLVDWAPQAEQLKFHLRRFKHLSWYFPLVFDASHWWLNCFEFFISLIPDVKGIGLYRDVEACTHSFMRIKQYGRGSVNHWVPMSNDVWRSAPWNPTYPTYAIPANAAADPDAAKSELISRYIADYNVKLHALAERWPSSVLLARTEDLGQIRQQQELFGFVGCAGKVSNIVLNVNTVADGEGNDYRF